MDFMNQYDIREIFITVWNFWVKYNGKSVHLRSNLPAQDSKRNKKKHSQQSLTCFFRAHLFKCHSFLLALFVSPLSITCSGNPECQLLKFSVTLPDVIKRLWRAPQCIATSRLSGLEQGSWTGNNGCKMHCGRGCEDFMTIKEGHALCTRSIGTLQRHILHRQLPALSPHWVAVNSAPRTDLGSHASVHLSHTVLSASQGQTSGLVS